MSTSFALFFPSTYVIAEDSPEVAVEQCVKEVHSFNISHIKDATEKKDFTDFRASFDQESSGVKYDVKMDARSLSFKVFQKCMGKQGYAIEAPPDSNTGNQSINNVVQQCVKEVRNFNPKESFEKKYYDGFEASYDENGGGIRHNAKLNGQVPPLILFMECMKKNGYPME